MTQAMNHGVNFNCQSAKTNHSRSVGHHGLNNTFLVWRGSYGIALATIRSQVRVPAALLHVTTLGKLFTRVPLFTKQYKLVPAQAWC